MKITTTLSLALNALLAGFVLWLACAGARPELRADFSRFLTNRVLRVKPQPAPPSASEPVPEVVETTEPFHWAQMESADYRVYLSCDRMRNCFGLGRAGMGWERGARKVAGWVMGETVDACGHGCARSEDRRQGSLRDQADFFFGVNISVNSSSVTQPIQ